MPPLNKSKPQSPPTALMRWASLWAAHRQRMVVVALAIVALGFGATSYYFYDKYASIAGDPRQETEQETAALISSVSRLIILPEGEQPTIATVSDPEQLHDQPFFANAKKGDKVLIYTNAKRAILYDPVADRIIEVAPINIGNASLSPSPTPNK
ncbi:MAG: hypothetical protein AAB864_02135 [Patescibacteria group bacterium]